MAMWADRQQDLTQQRAALQARSQALRQRLGEQALVLQHPLALADQVRGHWITLRNQPRWLLSLGLIPLLPLLLRPRRLLAWGLRLWGGWRLWKQVRDYLPMRQAQPRSQPQAPWKPPPR
jgi:hypothetical protein